jgi:8-oxo-dGTP pyrophosphatase MutT (NUDIX family)
MAKLCDNASVGVLVRGEGGRWLVFDRVSFPPGAAPCAGHVFDEHAGYEDAARAEVREELGLHVETLELTRAGGWRPNRCRRDPGPSGVGHDWRVYLATVSGVLAPSPRETRNARWLDAAGLQRLADRTAAWAHGKVPDGEFATEPGIEPVWAAFLAELGIVTISAADLAAIEASLATGAVR